MKKTLKSLVLSVLTCNLLVGTMSTIVMAEDGAAETTPATPVETVETPPAETPNPSDDGQTGEEPAPNPESDPDPEPEPKPNPEEGEESSSEESTPEESTPEESTPTQPVTPVVPSYPEYPTGTYIPPRVTPRTAVTSAPTTTEDTGEPTVADGFTSSANLENLTNLLANSLNDEDFLAAWEDYQVIIQNFKFKDKQVAEATGSTLSEITEGFEGTATPEEVVTEEGEKTLVFTYGSGDQAEGATPVQIILYADVNDYLVGAALLQASTTQYEGSPLASEDIQSIFLRPNSEFYAKKPFVKAVYQELSNDVMYTTVATSSIDEDSEELVIIDNQLVLNHVTTEKSEISLLLKVRELSKIFIESLEDESATDEDGESSESSESDAGIIEEEEVNEFVKRFAPTNYEEEKITDYDKISSGYQGLIDMIQNNTLTVTDEQIVELLGEPAAKIDGGVSTYYSYYSIEDERIVLFDIQVDSSSNVVTTMKYDFRTPRLDEEFAINVEELFALAKENLSMSNLVSALGEPNIVEHIFAGGHQTRNVWTSYLDPEMRNVEAFEDTASGKVELYYYDQD
ncbi:hypothetical protein ACF3NG_02385 [Aerococcaceae bacterium WGS1372]